MSNSSKFDFVLYFLNEHTLDDVYIYILKMWVVKVRDFNCHFSLDVVEDSSTAQREANMYIFVVRIEEVAFLTFPKL